MSLALDNSKFLALNAKVTEGGLIFSQINSHRSSDPAFLCRPSSREVPFTMITDPQAIFRAFQTDTDYNRSTHRQSRPGTRVISRGSIRPQSAVVKSVNAESLTRLSTEQKKALEIANIRSVTKLSLQRFHDNLVKVKKQDAVMKSKMEELQSTWEGAINSRILNYRGSKMVDKVLERNSTLRSRLTMTQNSQLDIEEQQLAKSVQLDSSPLLGSTIKVKPLLANRKAYASFFKETTMHKSLKKTMSPKIDKEESLSSTIRDRIRYNSFVQAYQGPTVEPPSASEKDLPKSAKGDEESPLSEKCEKITEERANLQNEECSIQKDRKELCSPTDRDSALLASPRLQSDLDSSFHDGVETSPTKPKSKKAKTTTDFGHLPMKPVGFMKLDAMSVIARVPAMHHRPLSARKRVKTASLSKILTTGNKETTDATQEISLQSKRILLDRPTETNRQMSPKKNQSDRIDDSSLRERPSINNDKSMLTIQGQKFTQGALNPRFRPRTASTGRFRNLNASTQGFRQDVNLNMKKYSNDPNKPTIMENMYSVKNRDIQSAGRGQEPKDGNKSVIESWLTRGGYGTQIQLSQRQTRNKFAF